MRQLRFVCSAAALAAILAGAAYGQNRATVTGTVHDASGAVVANANVTLTEVETGTISRAVTTASGDYMVPGLPAGKYTLDVSATGFKDYRVTDLTLDVGQQARINPALEVGQVSTQVSVEGGGVAQVDTESGAMSDVVSGKEISQIVLNGRAFTQLVTLVPGVSNQTGSDEGQVGIAGNVSFSVNGGRTEYNNWELDGGDNMDNGSNATLNVYPSIDAIAEFRVLTSSYGAQYGRNGSGTIETITKSGTKEFHGDVYEFNRNDAYNARNYFLSSNPEYKKNDWGYTLGGPVFIPKLYNKDKNKTFFFWSEEWRKDVVPSSTYNLQVPSAQERAGNFSDVCPGADCPINPATGNPFPNNTVPVSPQAAALLPLIPAANSPNNFYNAAPAQPTNWREELVRIDHSFNDNLRTFFRYAHDSWDTQLPYPEWGLGGASFPSVGTEFRGPAVSLVYSLTATISPKLVNEFTFSYTTDHIFLSTIGSVSRPSNFNMPGIYNNGFGGLLPSVTIAGGINYDQSGYVLDTGYFPWNNANPTYTYKDQLSHLVGSHNLYYGAYYVAAQKNEINSAPYLQGTAAFDNTDTSVSTGNAFADFLMGNIASYSQTSAKVKYYNRYKIAEPYFQDDWHVTKRLTFNLGLRVSLFGTYREKYHQEYNWEASAYNPADTANPFNGYVQCGVKGAPPGCMMGHLFNPAPRFGFAYDLTGDGKTAIRGGYGIFFEHMNGNEADAESLEGSGPNVQSATVYNVIGWNNVGSAAASGGAAAAPISIPTHAVWPYVQQWNLNVQHEIADTTLTVAYVGSKGTHLTDQRDINQLPDLPAGQNPFGPHQGPNCSGSAPSGYAGVLWSVACGASPDPYRPFQGYGDITYIDVGANSIYNALQVSARRHYKSLTLNVAYTYSHSLDDSSDRYDSNFADSYNLRLTRASSNFDQRHVLNIGYVWDLPFFTHPGWMHTAFGGWEWSGLTSFQTGTPFSVTDALYGPGVGNGAGAGSYLDIVGDPYSKPNASENNAANVIGPLLYNPAAFAQTTALTYGTSQRNELNLPSRTNFDMGLFKHFAITEQRAFEFRAEGFNVFNHTQWSGVNSGTNCFGSSNSPADSTCWANNNFLRPNGAHNARILQFGLKFLF